MSIRKVKVLKGRAKDEAEKKGLSPEDLVIVRQDQHIEKIDGDPVSFLLNKEMSCEVCKSTDINVSVKPAEEEKRYDFCGWECYKRWQSKRLEMEEVKTRNE